MTDEILMAVRRADVVVLALGESHLRNGEQSCIADLDLPAGQNELLRAVCQFQKPIVAVICAGRPLAITEVDQLADAVLYAWHPGHRGGTAIAEILFVNPSGAAGYIPRSTGQSRFSIIINRMQGILTNIIILILLIILTLQASPYIPWLRAQLYRLCLRSNRNR